MNGAQSLIQTLVNGGVEICFTNPGTSEMHFVAAVDKVAGMRTVLGLFEGVCTGAADGYARMAGKPAATLLHLGPGLANGMANLHNARRANSPMVNIVGDHATYHQEYDAPLASDIAGLARTVSGWVRSARDAAGVGADAAAAIAAALTPPGQIATLILPADCAWNEGGQPAPALAPPKAVAADQTAISQTAQVLRRQEPTILLLTGRALLADGLRLAGRVAQASGARLLCNTLNSRHQRGAGRVAAPLLPYDVKLAQETLAGTAHLILVGASPPVSFFAYPNLPSWLTPEGCQLHTLARPEEDVIGALEALVEELNAPLEPAGLAELKRLALPVGEITPEKIWAAVSALMPDETIVSNEAVTSGRGAEKWMAGAPPHDWLNVTGGAIGQGLPAAVGAAVACPERKVLAMEADGSGMYTLQALWTQAREKLDIVNIVFSNRAYAILQGELKRVGAGVPGPKATEMLSLDNPELDWVKLANGMGVEAGRVTTMEAFNRELAAAMGRPGPYLIEVVL
jgi:acetolactate synthase-1/2/3 large subunit